MKDFLFHGYKLWLYYAVYYVGATQWKNNDICILYNSIQAYILCESIYNACTHVFVILDTTVISSILLTLHLKKYYDWLIYYYHNNYTP